MESDLFSKHPEWSAVSFIVQTLEKRGHQAVLAGGCVRDALLGKLAKDLDVATDATPDQVESYFPRVLPVGKSFGVCRVVHEGHSIEVATFRQEFDYRDGRRPSMVEFSSLEKDAERRDFTINALYYDIGKKQVIDLVRGEQDLKDKCVRAVGDPQRRLNEDYLRILRGVRFAGHLNFSIEEKTLSALRELAVYLPRISRERIYDELNKMFMSLGRARCLKVLMDLDILKVLFPDWDLSQKLKVFNEERSLADAFACIGAYAGEESLLGWTVFYHLRSQQLSARETEKEFLEMKLPRATIDAGESIVGARRFLSQTGDEQLITFISLVETGYLASAEIYWDTLRGDQKFSQESETFKRAYFYKEALPAPLVTGHDLLKKGFPQGAQMKKQLQDIYLEQLKHPKLLKDDLLKKVVAHSN